MDIKKELLKKEASKAQCTKIVKYIGDDAERFAELVALFINEEYRVVQRAAWPISYCVEEHPELVKPHLKKLIINLKKSKLDPVKRNTLRFLQHIDIPKNLLGITADLSFQFLLNKKEAIAIRVFAMTVLFNIVKQEPELARELKLIITEQFEEESPAYKSRGRKILLALEKVKY